MNYSIFFSEEPFSSVLLPEHYSTHCQQCFVCFINELLYFIFFSEEPFSSVLLPEHYSTHCHQCYMRFAAPLPCKKCTQPRYCRYVCSSVADPWHFSTDPDPDPRIRTTDLRFWIRIRIRILLWIMLFSSVTFMMPTKNNFFLQSFFCLLLFEGTVHLNLSSKTKNITKKKSQSSRNQGFSYYFCLMTEGSRSDCINNDGSGRSKYSTCSKDQFCFTVRRVQHEKHVFCANSAFPLVPLNLDKGEW